MKGDGSGGPSSTNQRAVHVLTSNYCCDVRSRLIVTQLGNACCAFLTCRLGESNFESSSHSKDSIRSGPMFMTFNRAHSSDDNKYTENSCRHVFTGSLYQFARCDLP